MHHRFNRKHIWCDKVCMTRGKAATKSDGPGFDGSEPAARWKGIK